ncbi:ABC transporter permease [Peptoniphilus sp. GNH]|nr:ABC transporter, permease protein [Clostridiales bacterium KA00134]UHR02293.1 ABC transporter permease [Peptoniphilus sp. GNH]
MDKVIEIINPAIIQTIYMVGVSSIIAIVLGLFFGIILTLTRPGGLWQMASFYRALDFVVNIMRSMPFIILMIVVLPLTKIIVGKGYGTNAAIVPLAISAIPFVARLVEVQLIEIDKGIIEAAKSMGASTFQIVFKVMLPEAMPSILNGFTLTIINIIGYSAMAGAMGGGGLGDVAMRYGYQRRQYDILLFTVIAIVILVQVIQITGDFISAKLNKK